MTGTMPISVSVGATMTPNICMLIGIRSGATGNRVSTSAGPSESVPSPLPSMRIGMNRYDSIISPFSCV
jgi:hypothetical protein